MCKSNVGVIVTKLMLTLTFLILLNLHLILFPLLYTNCTQLQYLTPSILTPSISLFDNNNSLSLNETYYCCCQHNWGPRCIHLHLDWPCYSLLIITVCILCIILHTWFHSSVNRDLSVFVFKLAELFYDMPIYGYLVHIWDNIFYTFSLLLLTLLNE